MLAQRKILCQKGINSTGVLPGIELLIFHGTDVLFLWYPIVSFASLVLNGIMLKRSSRRFLSLIAFASPLLLVSICIGETLRIGYIGAQTGDAAAIGSEIARTLAVAVSEINSAGGINGQQVELVVEDDGYQITRAISAYEKLKSSINSRVIFMTTYGALFALGKRPEKDQIVVVDTLDCNDALVRISKMHSCVATRTESIGETFLSRIEKRGGGSVAVLYEEEAWFNFIVSTLRARYGSDLLEIPAPVQAADYRAEVLKLKAKGVKHIVFLGNDSMGRAMEQARGIGISANFYSIASVMSPGFQALAGKALEGTVVSNWVIPRNKQYQKFASRFTSLHDRPIQLEFVAGPTADAASLVFAALKTIGAEKRAMNAENLRQAMTEHQSFEGISGTIKMDPDGAVRTVREVAYVYKNGDLVLD